MSKLTIKIRCVRLTVNPVFPVVPVKWTFRQSLTEVHSSNEGRKSFVKGILVSRVPSSLLSAFAKTSVWALSLLTPSASWSAGEPRASRWESRVRAEVEGAPLVKTSGGVNAVCGELAGSRRCTRPVDMRYMIGLSQELLRE